MGTHNGLCAECGSPAKTLYGSKKGAMQFKRFGKYCGDFGCKRQPVGWLPPDDPLERAFVRARSERLPVGLKISEGSYHDDARAQRVCYVRVLVAGQELRLEEGVDDREFHRISSSDVFLHLREKMQDEIENGKTLARSYTALEKKVSDLEAKLKERDNQPGETYWEDRWKRARASYEKQLAVLRQTIEDLKVDKEHYRAVAMAADVAKVGIFDEQEIDVTQFRHRPAHGKARSFKIPQHRPIQYTALIRKPYLKRRPWWKFIFCRKDK